MSNYYRIKVPKDNFQVRPETQPIEKSIIPKYNRKFQLERNTNQTLGEKGIDFKATNAGHIEYAGTEYNLERIIFFNGLYNDYSDHSSIKSETHKEVLLEHKDNSSDSANGKLYIFFLLSTTSHQKSGFFDTWKNPSNKIITPALGGKFDLEDKSIIDMIPKTNKVHILEDTYRAYFETYEENTEHTHTDSIVMIVPPIIQAIKFIPVNDKVFGSFFTPTTNADTGVVTTEQYSISNTRTIKLASADDGDGYCYETGCATAGGSGTSMYMQWMGKKDDGNAEQKKDDKSNNDVIWFNTKTGKYNYRTSPFMMALGVGGVGSIMTTCVEVTKEDGKTMEGEHIMPELDQKYQTTAFGSWAGVNKNKSAADIEAEEKAFNEFFQDPNPGFYILIVVGILIALFIFIILINHVTKKEIPKLLRAQGSKVTGN